MKVDKSLLKLEKKIYGDDFSPISEAWSAYLGIKITEKDVAMMMAQMKNTRVAFIQDKINNIKDKTGVLIKADLQEELEGQKKTSCRKSKKKSSLFIYSYKF